MLGLGVGLRTPVPNIPGAQLCSELTIVEFVTLDHGNHCGGLCHTNDQPSASLRLFQPLLKEEGSMAKQRQQGVCCQKTMAGVSGVTNQSPCHCTGMLKRNV